MRYYKYAKAHKQRKGNGRLKSTSRDNSGRGNGNTDQAEESSRRCPGEARGIEGRQGQSGKTIRRKKAGNCQKSRIDEVGKKAKQRNLTKCGR